MEKKQIICGKAGLTCRNCYQNVMICTSNYHCDVRARNNESKVLVYSKDLFSLSFNYIHAVQPNNEYSTYTNVNTHITNVHFKNCTINVAGRKSDAVSSQNYATKSSLAAVAKHMLHKKIRCCK